MRLRAKAASGGDMGTGKGVWTRDMEVYEREQTDNKVLDMVFPQQKRYPAGNKTGRSCDMSHIVWRWGRGTEIVVVLPGSSVIAVKSISSCV